MTDVSAADPDPVKKPDPDPNKPDPNLQTTNRPQ